MDLLILDWPTLPCKHPVALPNVFFFPPEHESVVCFTRLSAVRSSANRWWRRSKRLCSQGSCEGSSEESSFLIMNYKRTTCIPSDAIWGRLCETARSRDVKNRVLIAVLLVPNFSEISPCNHLWMFFTKKRVEQGKKKTSSLKKTNGGIPEWNLDQLDWNAGANHSNT